MGWLDELKKKRKEKYKTSEVKDSGDSSQYKGLSVNEIKEKSKFWKDAVDEDDKKKKRYSDGGMARKHGERRLHDKAKKSALMIIIAGGKPKK